ESTRCSRVSRKDGGDTQTQIRAVRKICPRPFRGNIGKAANTCPIHRGTLSRLSDRQRGTGNGFRRSTIVITLSNSNDYVISNTTGKGIYTQRQGAGYPTDRP